MIDGYEKEGDSDDEPSQADNLVDFYPCEACMAMYLSTGVLDCEPAGGRSEKCTGCSRSRETCNKQKALWPKNPALRAGLKELRKMHAEGKSNAVPHKATSGGEKRVTAKATKEFSKLAKPFKP